MFASRRTMLTRELAHPDALVASDDHRRRDFVLWDSFSNKDGFTALIRSRISGMRQTGEDQFGASWTARVRGFEASAFRSPRLGVSGRCDSRQHPTIEKTGAGVMMRGRTP
jgi:hypothetical protein